MASMKGFQLRYIFNLNARSIIIEILIIDCKNLGYNVQTSHDRTIRELTIIERNICIITP